MVISKRNDSKLAEMIAQGFIKPLDEQLYLFWFTYKKADVYPEESVLFYKEHNPFGVHLLMKGSAYVEYFQERKIKYVHIDMPAMIGLNHIVSSSPYKYSVITHGKTEFIFIPKSVLSELKIGSKFRL